MVEYGLVLAQCQSDWVAEKIQSLILSVVVLPEDVNFVVI